MVQSLFYIPTILALLALAVVVVAKCPRSTINIIFSVFICVVAAWMTFLYLGDLSTDDQRALFYVRNVKILDPFLAYLFLLFCLRFPFRTIIDRYKHVLLLVPPLSLSLLAFSPWYISGVDASGRATIPSENTALLTIYFIYILAYYTLAFGVLFTKFKSATSLQKGQIKLVASSMFVTVAIGVSYAQLQFVLHPDSTAQFMFIPAILTTALVLAAAVMRLRLFDLRNSMANSIIFVEDQIGSARDYDLATYKIQTLIYESNANNIALNFTGVDRLDEQFIAALEQLRLATKKEGRHLHFIGYNRRLWPQLRHIVSPKTPSALRHP